MNYEELLIKYMAHIIDMEGYTFVDSGESINFGSKEDHDKLFELSKKAKILYNEYYEQR
jgi:hypothetical protein